MNAVEFVKKFGWDLAQRDVVCLETGFITKKDFLDHYGFEILDDLKRLVESWELVESKGGLAKAREWVEKTCFPLSDNTIRLKRAVYDVESVGGGV